MPQPSKSSSESPSPLNAWPTTSRPSKNRAKSDQRSSRRPSTTAKSAQGKRGGRQPRQKNRNRRDHLLRKLQIDLEVLAVQPEITSLLKECGIQPSRVIEVL